MTIPRPEEISPSQAVIGRQRLGRRGAIALGIILLVCAAQQAAILTDAWRQNPLAADPILDARVYWDRAAEIAAGKLSETTPYMGAPLYSYFLGAIRALGGGLLAAYVVQAGLHLATIALLGVFAARRFTPLAGLLAACAYGLLTEAAFYPGRIVTCTLQAFLVCVTYAAIVRAQERSSWAWWPASGLAAGAAAAANPPMLLAIVLLAAWIVLRKRPAMASVREAVGFGLGAAAAIAPFTIHNYRVAGELIPISAQAGVTFAQGNSPGAIGIYNVLPGVSRDRREQNLDVLRIARRETTADCGWNGASRHFFNRGWAYLRENPADAMRLWGRKLMWFLSSGTYGDIYLPTVERAEGVARALWLAPAPLPWIAWPAVVVALWWLWRARTFGPEALLALVPLVVVVLFFYSPRYRFPAAPMLALGFAVAITTLLQWRARKVAALLIGIVTLGGPLLAHVVTSLPGPLHDTVDSWRAPVLQKLALLANEKNNPRAAEAYARRSLALEPNDALTHHILAQSLEAAKDLDGAALEYRAAIERDKHLLAARYRLGEILMRRGRADAGLAEFQNAVAIAPNDPEPHARLAPALGALGRMAEADEEVNKAIELAQQQGQSAVADGYRTWWADLKSKAARKSP
ncbi:MAG: glycosyltransferase family 39 protein [Planctomycetes bacterium]|nr:glycosyltransferase family 39 protein [Planctomycetota bacterium]